MSTTTTKQPFSALVFWLCFLQAVLALFASAFWYEGITKDTEGWSSMVFISAVVPLLGGGTLLFGLIPSAVLYFRGRQRSDLMSFRISSITLGVIALEAAYLVWRGH
jgi:hypothetical protein